MTSRISRTWGVLKGMKARMDAADLSLVAAGGAFFAMLSLFPGLAAVIALLGFVADPYVLDDQLETLRDFVPPQAFTIIDVQIRRLLAANSSVLGWATALSTAAALWSARRGTDALIKAINRVFGAPARGGLRANMAAFLITLSLVLVVTVAMVAMVLLPVVLAFVPLGPLTEIAIDAARWLLSLGIVITGIWVIYRFAPHLPRAEKRKVRWFSPGTALAIAVWAAASYGFSYYLNNFGSYNEIYGSIGAVIALLMFLYITIFTVLLGATLNAELWQGPSDGQDRPSDAKDTSAGDMASGALGGKAAAASAQLDI